MEMNDIVVSNTDVCRRRLQFILKFVSGIGRTKRKLCGIDISGLHMVVVADPDISDLIKGKNIMVHGR